MIELTDADRANINAERVQAENRLLRECARTPDLERIDAAIDAAREKP